MPAPGSVAILRFFFAQVSGGRRQRAYDLRGSINTEMEAAGVSLLVQRYVTGHRTNDIQNHYVSLDPHMQMRKYFNTLAPLFDAIRGQARRLGLLAPPTPPVADRRRNIIMRASPASCRSA